MSNGAAAENDLFGAAAHLIGGYRASAGAWDEMIDEHGAPRPHWRAFVEALARIGPNEVARRFNGAARHLREADVFYRVFEHGVASARPWPLSGAPVVISAQDWRTIAEGVKQRASLLEHVLRDAYGPQNLVREGALPAPVISGSPDFLRPMVGGQPKGGRFLRFYAADLGRGPDGRWWVLDDRAQAPSGAGFALENRIVLSRALPDALRDLDVERLAGFFETFRASLSELAGPDAGRICVLTPGPLSETYFEHAYLARYLGFLLAQGEDLIVRHDRVYLRTIAGLRRADVLLRRLDADFADPLALNAASRIGAPGLARAAKQGHVALANALGAGLVESRALKAFLPMLAEKVLGAPLALPTIATWWCGQANERARVHADLEKMAVAPAFSQAGPAPFERGAVSGASLSISQKEKLRAQLETRGMDYVGQEVAKLSTTPVWSDGRFTPRPFVLRVFVAATGEDDWTVMPGGFARISDSMHSNAVGMQHGGGSADVWVMSDAPVEQKSLLVRPNEQPIRRQTHTLTSRAADNLFWLARYLERAEASLRIARAIAARAGERDRRIRDVKALMGDLLIAWGAADNGAPIDATRQALTRMDCFGGVPALATAARQSASTIRDLLSPDAWRVIADFAQMFPGGAFWPDADLYDRADAGLRTLASFAGLAQENMTRAEGWRFLEIGKRIERAIAASRCVRALASPQATRASIDALLELGDCQITYAQRYFLTSSRAAAIDLMVLDPTNPRSCAFQANRLHDLVNRLPGHRPEEMLTHCQRLVERLTTELHVIDANDLDESFLLLQEEGLMVLSEGLSDRYLINRDRLDLSGEDGEA